MKTVHLIIKGKVQGVFYRATAKNIAEEIGVRGWVKNTKEGDVEAMVSGTDEQIEQFVKWCWEGPRRAKVSDVSIVDYPPEEFTKFSVIR